MADQPLPYQDPTLGVEQRVDDLLARMELVDKAGLMFHDMVGMGPAGQLAVAGNQVARPPTAEVIQRQRMNHLNLVGGVADVRDLVAWHNAVQETALATPLGIPVTISTDPRHSFSSNPATAPSRSGRRHWAWPPCATEPRWSRIGKSSTPARLGPRPVPRASSPVCSAANPGCES